MKSFPLPNISVSWRWRWLRKNGGGGLFAFGAERLVIFLGKGKLPAAQIKAIVEMRMLSLAGFMPDLICCAQCGAYEADQMYFMVKQGSLYCGSCYPQFAPGGVLMNRGVTTALRHTIYADFNKVFSFTLPAKDLEALAKASERYLLNTVERGFATLDFYKQICVPSSPDHLSAPWFVTAEVFDCRLEKPRCSLSLPAACDGQISLRLAENVWPAVPVYGRPARLP